MSKRKPSYTRDNVPCSGTRVYVETKGLTMGAAEVKGAACILVFLKQVAPRNKWEREFVFWTNKLNLQVRACDAKAEAMWATRENVKAAVVATGQAAFEVYGTPEALEGLVELPCVEKWEYLLSGAPNVYVKVQGAGPEKVKPTKPKVKPDVTWGGSPEENGMTAHENEQTKWESHKDAMGTLVKGCGSLPS